MYKCTECGAEYTEKPDYCDCGNDVFEEVSGAVKEEKTVVQPSAAESSKKFNPPPAKKTFDEKYSFSARFKSSVDPISLTIFCVCIILSLYVVFFAFNPVENASDQIESSKSESKSVQTIPSIDKIWNSTPPSAPMQEVKKEEEVKPVEVKQQNVVKQALPIKKQTNPNKTNFVQKTVTPPKNTNIQNTQKIQAEKKAEEEAKKKAEQERLAAEALQLKKLQEEQAKKQAEAKAKQEQQAKQEFAVYKSNLRNAIGRKIDFTRVIGDGDCTVVFKLDSNGRLVNRSFAKQSSNNTLNDAVYAAIMATPSFNPPPSAYKNEVLNLTIRFSNGNFEITLQ